MSAPAVDSRPRELVDELGDALICLLAVVDLADCRGVSDDLHQDAKRKARAALRRLKAGR